MVISSYRLRCQFIGFFFNFCRKVISSTRERPLEFGFCFKFLSNQPPSRASLRPEVSPEKLNEKVTVRQPDVPEERGWHLLRGRGYIYIYIYIWSNSSGGTFISGDTSQIRHQQTSRMLEEKHGHPLRSTPLRASWRGGRQGITRQ